MTEPEKNDPAQRLAEARPGSLIFISHDTRDAGLAEAFSKLLNGVSAGVLKSFRSSDRKGVQGIEYGVEWYPQLMEKLNAASDVVCLLTHRSLERPWILYEAGVAKGKLNTPVYGIALGIPLNRASSGPFAQFQNCADGEEELTKLVMQLVRRIPGSEPDMEALQMQVRMFKERVDKVLKGLVDDSSLTEEEPAETSVAKLFEEVKVMFQDLPLRIEKRVSGQPGSRRWRRFHPMVFHELVSVVAEAPDDPLGIIVAAGFFRDEMPWLFELAMEAYRAARIGDMSAFAVQAGRIQRVLDLLSRGPFLEGMGLSPDHQMYLREFLPILMRQFDAARYRPSNKPVPEATEASKPPSPKSEDSPGFVLSKILRKEKGE